MWKLMVAALMTVAGLVSQRTRGYIVVGLIIVVGTVSAIDASLGGAMWETVITEAASDAEVIGNIGMVAVRAAIERAQER